jgi:hypothetical protein
MIYIEKSHVIADELAELLLRVKLELVYKKATPMSQQDRDKGQAKSKLRQVSVEQSLYNASVRRQVSVEVIGPRVDPCPKIICLLLKTLSWRNSSSHWRRRRARPTSVVAKVRYHTPVSQVCTSSASQLASWKHKIDVDGVQTSLSETLTILSLF